MQCGYVHIIPYRATSRVGSGLQDVAVDLHQSDRTPEGSISKERWAHLFSLLCVLLSLLLTLLEFTVVSGIHEEKWTRTHEQEALAQRVSIPSDKKFTSRSVLLLSHDKESQGQKTTRGTIGPVSSFWSFFSSPQRCCKCHTQTQLTSC